jgi:hypothetical protein
MTAYDWALSLLLCLSGLSVFMTRLIPMRRQALHLKEPRNG